MAGSLIQRLCKALIQKSVDITVCISPYFALAKLAWAPLIVNRFSSNKSRNDFLVQRFIEKRSPFSLPKYRTDVKKQRAIAQHNKHIV